MKAKIYSRLVFSLETNVKLFNKALSILADVDVIKLTCMFYFLKFHTETVQKKFETLQRCLSLQEVSGLSSI